MGFGRELPWLLMVALCAAIAIGVAAYALGAGTISGFQVSVALIGLAISQLVLFIRFATRSAKHDNDLRRMSHENVGILRETREERRVAADLSSQVSLMRTEAQNLSNAMVAGLNELRQNYGQVSESLRLVNARPNLPGASPARSAANTEFRQPASANGAAYEPPLPPDPDSRFEVPFARNRQAAEPVHSDRGEDETDIRELANALILSLEPVIDLFSGQTAHYRLHYGMESDNGRDVSQEFVSHHAEQARMRPSLDVHLARETLILLKRLRRRDPKLSIFLPIGASTLSSREGLQQIVALRGESSDGQGLVVDVPHAVLASLPDSALEGLAYLARAGLELSLNNAAVSGLDLGSLDKLNVRYVGVSAASVGAEPKMSKGIAGFVQAARALGINVIVAGVASAQQATQLMRIARYASGPAFATPRRVRRETASPSASAHEEYSAAAE